MFGKNKEQRAASRKAKLEKAVASLRAYDAQERPSEKEISEIARKHREAFAKAIAPHNVEATYTGEPIKYSTRVNKDSKMQKRWKKLRRLKSGQMANLNASEFFADEDLTPDDLSWSVSDQAILTVAKIANTLTARVTASAINTGSAYVIATQISTGATGRLKITVTAPDHAVLSPDDCSVTNLTSVDVTVGSPVSVPVTLDLEQPDDGTYQYLWYLNGSGTGFGTISLDTGGDNIVDQGDWVTGAIYSSVYFGTSKGGSISSTTNQPYWGCQVKDADGNVFSFPSNWGGKGSERTNAQNITLS